MQPRQSMPRMSVRPFDVSYSSMSAEKFPGTLPAAGHSPVAVHKGKMNSIFTAGHSRKISKGGSSMNHLMQATTEDLIH